MLAIWTSVVHRLAKLSSRRVSFCVNLVATDFNNCVVRRWVCVH